MSTPPACPRCGAPHAKNSLDGETLSPSARFITVRMACSGCGIAYEYPELIAWGVQLHGEQGKD